MVGVLAGDPVGSSASVPGMVVVGEFLLWRRSFSSAKRRGMMIATDERLVDVGGGVGNKNSQCQLCWPTRFRS